MDRILNLAAQSEANLAIVLAHCLLFRLGGQQVFTEEEVREIHASYLGTRIFMDPKTGVITLTLKPAVQSAGPG